jgi:hypothetical protein
MRLSVVISAAILTLCSCLTQAQNTPQQKQLTPEEMQKLMDATMGAMVPVVGRMTEVMLEAQLKVAEKSETAERVATFKKNLYDALLKKGFTPEQSMQITLTTALPSASPSSK